MLYLDGKDALAIPREAASDGNQLLAAFHCSVEIHKNQAGSTVVAGIIGFGAQRSIRGVARRFLERALVVSRRRLVAQDDDDFSVRFDSRIVVIAVVFGGNPITGENNFTFGFSGLRQCEGNPILVQSQWRTVVESEC